MRKAETIPFIIEKLLPEVERWGFTEANLQTALGKVRIPNLLRPKKATVRTDAHDMDSVRAHGSSVQHAVALLTSGNTAQFFNEKRNIIVIAIKDRDGTISLKVIIDFFPEFPAGPSRKRYPSDGDIDPQRSHGGLDLVVQRFARRLH